MVNKVKGSMPSNGNVWIEIECMGKKLFQYIGGNETCENTGVNVDQLSEGLRLEFSQLASPSLKVGDWVDEKGAIQISQRSGLKIVASRWVLVQKNETLVRARLVCKDFRSSGLTSLREHLYSPIGVFETSFELERMVLHAHLHT